MPISIPTGCRLIDADPRSRRPDCHQIRHKANRLLIEQETQLMLHRAERLRDKVLLVLLYETAARPQEVRELRWPDINWDEKEVHLYSRKTKEDRDLPLNESMKHLQRWKAEWVYPDPRDEDFIFPSIAGSHHDRRKPISVSYISRIIKSIAKKQTFSETSIRICCTTSENAHLERMLFLQASEGFLSPCANSLFSPKNRRYVRVQPRIWFRN